MNLELLQLAREAIESKFGKELIIDEKIKKKYSRNQACFVTLTEKGGLRGCIGSLAPSQELWKDVIDNAINAAFFDPRFLPVDQSELDDIKIEISILNIPKKLEFLDEHDLLEKIDKKMGIILKKGYNSATFLPQVWEEIPDKVKFLEQLSLKAGLGRDSWKTADYRYYRVDLIKEQI